MASSQNLTDRQRAMMAKRARVTEGGEGTSSSAPQPQRRPVHRFPEQISPRYQPKVPLDILRRRPVIHHRTFAWPDLDRLGYKDQILGMLTEDWKRLFAIRTPTYRPIVEEFFSTFRMDYNIHHTKHSSMTFRLGGQDYTMSYAEFGVHMGLYTEEEVKKSDFKNGLATWPHGMNANEFWRTHNLGPGEHNNNTKQSALTNPVHRILLRGIAESIANRGNCVNNATAGDLFYLYCIIERKPCNLARCLAFYLYDKGHGGARGSISGGSFVCRLAFNLGAFDESQLEQQMGAIAWVKYIDTVALRNIGIIDRGNHRGDESSSSEDSEDEDQDQGADGAEPESQAAGRDTHLSPGLVARLATLELNTQEARDYHCQSLHQLRYISETNYDYYRHQGMQLHVPPHMFIPQEPDLPLGAAPLDGGHYSLFAQREDLPPLPHQGGYMSYPAADDGPTFSYPQFGTYRGSQSSGWGLPTAPPQFGDYQGGTPSVFSHPDDMDE